MEVNGSKAEGARGPTEDSFNEELCGELEQGRGTDMVGGDGVDLGGRGRLGFAGGE